MTVPVANSSKIPVKWNPWLKKGWHGLSVEDWATQYLPEKFKADLCLLNQLNKKKGWSFSLAARRLRRNVVNDLVRQQHLLPWNKKKEDGHFFVEITNEENLKTTDREHALPVSQIVSMVLMAVDDNNMEMALKRLTFAWLVPTVLCTTETHKKLSRKPLNRCKDFELPYQRYGGIDGLRLKRFDGEVIDPKSYTRKQLIDDLRVIREINGLVEPLADLNLPMCEDEHEYTIENTKRPRRA